MSEENGEDIFGFLSGPETDDPRADGGSAEFSSQLFGGPSKDAVLFCIDCSHLPKLMEESDSESKYEVALRAMYSFMRNKVVASDGSDMTGLVFYNVSTASNPLRQKRINLVQPLATLSARCIQEVGELSRLSESDFSVRFGDPTSDADISDLLFVCNAQFKKISASYRPRMFIFTSNDDPCGTDRKARKAAHTRASDFHEGMSQGAEINLIPFLLGINHDFDVTKFWEPILLLSSRVDEERDSGERKDEFVQNSVLQLSDMNEISLKKLFKKRPVNRINFFISTGSAKVALMMYTSYYAAGKPKHMYVDPDTLQPLRSETRFVSDFTGAVLDPYSDQIETFVEFQGKQVPLTKQDILSIKRTVEDQTDNKGVSGSLHLIGFRPSSFLKPEYCVGHSCFLYPQDERISGSGVVMSALINRLHERGLIAIARAMPKANSSLQLVALVPQVEVLDNESGRQEKSPGLFLVRLPFADDLRDLTLNETNIAYLTIQNNNQNAQEESGRKEQVSAAKRVVETLSEPHWEPDMLDNPALKVCYTCIEAIALAIPPDQTVQVDDLLHPDPQKANAAQHLSSDWLNTMNMLDTSACASSASGGAVVKKIKVEAKADDCEKLWTEVEVKHLIETGMIAKLTVPDLKLVIKQIDKLKHLSTQGRKEELINKIKFNINI